ncbi:MAG: RNA polymerase sigma factor [Chitinophagales bacterium]
MENFNEWLTDFKAGKSKAVNMLYEEFRPVFVLWLLGKFKCEEEEAIDIFQDSIIIIYKNAHMGKLNKMSSQLKTYLFAIGKNVFLKRREKKKTTVSDEPLKHIPSPEIDAEKQLQLKDRKKMIAQLLKKMKDPCKTILYLFFYRRYSIEAIQKSMNYKSREVVRSQKVRCIKGLEKKVWQMVKSGEI